ncbi:hypothetical protein GC425_02860 [Corynebacterium sp. zg254]|uniref:Uncharacterized protein n=1 Tax=Corynebacterium zhongnanshanii TaxID=2768834 RepID=A0ABQ6VFA9_9CORY|nr:MULTISPECIES: hypothetical protein [Corynebacterium]KAB3523094.1 hypothetical protein F8377_02760 [Corynebacterium zhongnanshanii]MCR5913809.1 hypothetical protein [Corynebacterium sp. zg254]
MHHTPLTKVTALALGTVLMIQGATLATAAPSQQDSNYTSGQSSEQAQEIQQTAELLKALDSAKTPEEREQIFVSTLGEQDAQEAAAFVGLTPAELFSNELTTDTTSFRGAPQFLSCMKSKVSNDLKSIFNINAIASLIGQQKYYEAAVKAVQYLAKQGIKRNVAGIAGALAFYGAKCYFFK